METYRHHEPVYGAGYRRIGSRQMSEIRQPIAALLLKKQGKKTVKIERFPAMLWRRNWQHGKRNVSPQPILDPLWWQQRSRVRVDGKWYRTTRKKYNFFTLDEFSAVLQRLMDN